MQPSQLPNTKITSQIDIVPAIHLSCSTSPPQFACLKSLHIHLAVVQTKRLANVLNYAMISNTSFWYLAIIYDATIITWSSIVIYSMCSEWQFWVSRKYDKFLKSHDYKRVYQSFMAVNYNQVTVKFNCRKCKFSFLVIFKWGCLYSLYIKVC